MAVFQRNICHFEGLEQGETLLLQSVSDLAPTQSSGAPQRQSYGPGIGWAVAQLLTGSVRVYALGRLWGALNSGR